MTANARVIQVTPWAYDGDGDDGDGDGDDGDGAQPLDRLLYRKDLILNDFEFPSDEHSMKNRILYPNHRPKGHVDVCV